MKMARPQTHGAIIGNFSGVWYKEDQATMDELEDLRRKSGGSKADIIKQACKEYVKNHA